MAAPALLPIALLLCYPCLPACLHSLADAGEQPQAKRAKAAAGGGATGGGGVGGGGSKPKREAEDVGVTVDGLIDYDRETNQLMEGGWVGSVGGWVGGWAAMGLEGCVGALPAWLGGRPEPATSCC